MDRDVGFCHGDGHDVRARSQLWGGPAVGNRAGPARVGRMIDPYAEPGTPDHRGPGRYLWWLLKCQPGRTAAGAVLGSVWMVLITVSPYVMSRAVDDGLVPGDMGALARWCAVLFALGTFNAWVSAMRHRTMTKLRMDADFRTVKSVIGHAARLGAALPRQLDAGEVVTIGVTDVRQIRESLTLVGPGFGAIVAYLFVSVMLLRISVSLAAVVLLGMPVIGLLIGPLLGRLRGAETAYRTRQSVLTARIGDLAGGLRVLNGLGGKELYTDAFRRDSAALVAQGYRVGAVTSWVQALGAGLPALFLALVTWLAARMAVQGTITVGEMVGVYGYVAVLVVPVSFLIQFGYDLTRGLVAAGRTVRLLSLDPDPGARPRTADGPAGPAPLRDPESGVDVPPGLLTALVSARPAESAAVVDRLAGFTSSEATWGRVRVDDVVAERLRERILVADNEADLFAGTLREIVSGRWRPGEKDDETIVRALHAAGADDVVAGLPDGLGTAVDAQGRSLSGGQRQRVRLARALLADSEVLMALEPTSALDAHTEAAVAARLRAARSGRTTLVTSTSPLLLDQADRVVYLADGKVAAVGGHRELLVREPGYRGLVARGEEDEEPGDDRAEGSEAGTDTRAGDGDGDAGPGEGDDGVQPSEEAVR